MNDSKKKPTVVEQRKQLGTVSELQDALGADPIGFSSNDLPVVVRPMTRDMQKKSFSYNFHKK